MQGWSGEAWAKVKDLSKLPDPKPWSLVMEQQGVVPASMGVCAYDMLGTKLQDLSSMDRAMSISLADGYWKKLQRNFRHAYRDSVVYAVHDSIRTCLADLKKTDKRSWCIQKCLYDACNWMDNYDPGYSRACQSVTSPGDRIGCENALGIIRCMEDN